MRELTFDALLKLTIRDNNEEGMGEMGTEMC